MVLVENLSMFAEEPRKWRDRAVGHPAHPRENRRCQSTPAVVGTTPVAILSARFDRVAQAADEIRRRFDQQRERALQK